MKNVLPKIVIAILFNMNALFAYPPHDTYYTHPFESASFEIKSTGAGLISVSILKVFHLQIHLSSYPAN